MPTPWSMGNVFTVKSCKYGERVPDALNWGPVSQGRKPLQLNIDPPGLLGVGIELTRKPRKIICRERSAPTPGCRADDNDYNDC